MKVVYFLEDTGYNNNVCNCVRGEEDVLLPPGVRTPILRKLFELHNAWSLNQRWELPFKSVWFPFCIDESNLSPEDEIVFIFFESYHMTYSGKFLRYLKRKYPKSIMIYAFTNPADNYNLTKLGKVRGNFDVISTFSREDAEKHGFLFSDHNMCYKEEIPESDLPESDVFFVGVDKGRLDTLLAIYETLTAGGLRCDFHIVSVPEEKQKYADVIHYNQPLPYDQTLLHLSKAKCMLEVLQGDCAYNSRRIAEAYVYHKKVLTTNRRMAEEWYYSPEIVQIVTNPREIDIDFFKKEVDDMIYDQCDFYSFKSERKHLESVYRQVTTSKLKER